MTSEVIWAHAEAWIEGQALAEEAAWEKMVVDSSQLFASSCLSSPQLFSSPPDDNDNRIRSISPPPLSTGHMLSVVCISIIII